VIYCVVTAIWENIGRTALRHAKAHAERNLEMAKAGSKFCKRVYGECSLVCSIYVVVVVI
jgi:hypothetical protein